MKMTGFTISALVSKCFWNCNFLVLLCVKVTALCWALGSLLQTANQLDSFGGVVSQHLLCSSKAGLSSSLICKDIMVSTRNAELPEDTVGFYFCGSNMLTRGAKIITLIQLASSNAGIGRAMSLEES